MKPSRVILRKDQPATALEPMLRDHHALLSGASLIADQMAGELKETPFNRSEPPTLSSSLKKPPAQVVCLVARLADGSGSRMSGHPVHWTWGGTAGEPTITIDDIIGLADDTDYTVKLWLSEG